MSPERFVKGEAERTLPDLKGITLASFSVYRPCTLVWRFWAFLVYWAQRTTAISQRSGEQILL